MSYLRTQITSRIKAMLETLTRDNGYRTWIGRKVHVGLLRGAPGDAPCLYVLPGIERSAKQYGTAQTETEYKIAAFVNRLDTVVDGFTADPHAEWAIIDAMIADIREVMETRDATMHALIESITYEGSKPSYHEEGGELTGVEAAYSVRFAIATGDPDNQPT